MTARFLGMAAAVASTRAVASAIVMEWLRAEAATFPKALMAFSLEAVIRLPISNLPPLQHDLEIREKESRCVKREPLTPLCRASLSTHAR